MAFRFRCEERIPDGDTQTGMGLFYGDTRGETQLDQCHGADHPGGGGGVEEQLHSLIAIGRGGVGWGVGPSCYVNHMLPC